MCDIVADLAVRADTFVSYITFRKGIEVLTDRNP